MEPKSVNRRIFVRAGGLALVSLGFDPIFLTRAAYAVRGSSRVTARRKALICIFQRGAVDGLSMVVPHGEQHYYRNRPAIAIPPPGKADGALDLDGHFGLHPALAPIRHLYDERSLAVVHAVGSPAATRSHFDAQDFMESGTPGDKSTTNGWLNRYMEHDRDHRDTPFRGVAMGQQLPRVLRGTAPSLAIADLRTFGVRGSGPRGDRISRAFQELYRGSAEGLLAASSEEGFEAIRMLESVDADARPAHGAEYPEGRFGQSLRQLAILIKADLGLEIGFADTGGWDTHVNQGASQGTLATRLREFGRALAAFARDLGPKLADVTLLTVSEFGRTVRENGNRGTDHGRATAMLVMGGNVNGGRVLGRWPTLEPERLDAGRDLAVTTDFRDLFGEILVRHLGAADLNAVFPGHESDAARWVGAMRP